MKKKDVLKELNVGKYVLLILLIFISCLPFKKDPGKWQPGDYSCANCKMSIIDFKFKSAIITEKGKIVPFDSIECLLAWRIKNNLLSSRVFVSDYVSTKWILASDAFIFKSAKRPSPMGGFLSAYSSYKNALTIQKDFNGERIKI